MRAMQQEEFAAHLRNLDFVVACRVIGNETTYNKYLARQCLS